MLKLCKMTSYQEVLFMSLKLLIFGLPGSGKPTISRHITTYLSDRNWNSYRYSDHVILKKMYLADIEHKQFKLADHGAFDVTDFTVFDKALNELEQEIIQGLLSVKQEEVVLIEFARNDYKWAFQQFSDQFLFDAYFLYLQVDLEICKHRIRERITHPSTDDDFFVSDHIFNAYYNKDDDQSIQQVLTEDFGINIQRVMIIENNGSLSAMLNRVYKFVDIMCGFETM